MKSLAGSEIKNIQICDLQALKRPYCRDLVHIREPAVVLTCSAEALRLDTLSTKHPAEQLELRAACAAAMAAFTNQLHLEVNGGLDTSINMSSETEFHTIQLLASCLTLLQPKLKAHLALRLLE